MDRALGRTGSEGRRISSGMSPVCCQVLLLRLDIEPISAWSMAPVQTCRHCFLSPMRRNCQMPKCRRPSVVDALLLPIHRQIHVHVCRRRLSCSDAVPCTSIAPVLRPLLRRFGALFRRSGSFLQQSGPLLRRSSPLLRCSGLSFRLPGHLRSSGTPERCAA